MATLDTLNSLHHRAFDKEERFFRIHVLTLDAIEAFNEGDTLSFGYIMDEIIHYTHSTEPYPNSGRW